MLWQAPHARTWTPPQSNGTTHSRTAGPCASLCQPAFMSMQVMGGEARKRRGVRLAEGEGVRLVIFCASSSYRTLFHFFFFSFSSFYSHFLLFLLFLFLFIFLFLLLFLFLFIYLLLLLSKVVCIKAAST